MPPVAQLPEELTTPRLRLRPPTLDDAPAIYGGYATDPEVTRYLTWRPHRSLADTEAFLRRCEESCRRGDGSPRVIAQRDGGALLGMIDARATGHRVEIGYVLCRSAWGQGLMTEAVRRVVEAFLADASTWRVFALCDVENRASARVLEKAGLRREGVLRRHARHPNVSDVPRDVDCYARTR